MCEWRFGGELSINARTALWLGQPRVFVIGTLVATAAKRRDDAYCGRENPQNVGEGKPHEI
jgi:hypothetical protein